VSTPHADVLTEGTATIPTVPVPAAEARPSDHRARTLVHRLFSSRLSGAGVVLLVTIAVAVVVGPLLWGAGPNDQDLLARSVNPSWEHPLGTDSLGRDVLSRLLHGGRASLSIATAAVAISTAIGGLIGLVAGFVRGLTESILMRLMDVLVALPSLLLALLVSATLGPSIRNTVIAVVLPSIPADARMVRSVVLSVRERDFVLAARASGVRPWRIMVRHVLANCVGTVLVMASVSLGFVLLIVAGLGFLGLGAPPPDAEWGAMLSDASTYIVSRPVVVLAPGLAIFLTALAANLTGDALRDVVDPRM
jgi:ABC-type dipeptide/oligopeptide/nickel transport system permease subunit